MTKNNGLNFKGCHIYKGYLDRLAQNNLVEDVRSIVLKSPLFSPLTPWGKPMSVKMTSAGKYGWYSDHSGYRYVTRHPNGQIWPEIPASLQAIWRDLCQSSPEPECCLVNYYSNVAKMGLHQDKDENFFSSSFIHFIGGAMLCFG